MFNNCCTLFKFSYKTDAEYKFVLIDSNVQNKLVNESREHKLIISKAGGLTVRPYAETRLTTLLVHETSKKIVYAHYSVQKHSQSLFNNICFKHTKVYFNTRH